MSAIVLLVGHCAADQGLLRRWLERHFSVSVESLDSINDALRRVEQGGIEVVLANRVFEYTGERGVELIRRLGSSTKPVSTRALLISNFVDAQDDAVESGALPGFGKSQLQSAEAVLAFRHALDAQADKQSGSSLGEVVG